MFCRPLACAFFLLAGATAQESVPVSSAVLSQASSLLSSVAGVSSVVGTGASSVDGFMTIQTSVPSSLATATATGGILTNPLQSTATVPQLTFCDGVYTNTPCASATGMMSIPQGETPIPSSVVPTAVPSEDSTTSHGTSRTGTVSRPAATSSASGSVPEKTPSETPGAAASVLKHDGSFILVAALSGLSATLGFAWTLL